MAINANTQIYDKALHRAAMIRLYEQRVNGKVGLVIDGHTIRLDALIKGLNLTPAGQKQFYKDMDDDLANRFADALFYARADTITLFLPDSFA